MLAESRRWLAEVDASETHRCVSVVCTGERARVHVFKRKMFLGLKKCLSSLIDLGLKKCLSSLINGELSGRPSSRPSSRPCSSDNDGGNASSLHLHQDAKARSLAALQEQEELESSIARAQVEMDELLKLQQEATKQLKDRRPLTTLSEHEPTGTLSRCAFRDELDQRRLENIVAAAYAAVTQVFQFGFPLTFRYSSMGFF